MAARVSSKGNLHEQFLFGGHKEKIIIDAKNPVPGLRQYIKKMAIQLDRYRSPYTAQNPWENLCLDLQNRLRHDTPFSREELGAWKARVEKVEIQGDVELELRMPEFIYESD